MSAAEQGQRPQRRKSLAGEDPVWAQAAMQSVLLRKLAAAELKYVRGSLKERSVESGETLYSQEDEATDFYIVRLGRFVASERLTSGTGTRPLREYGRAATFGSSELLYSVPRQTTVTCIESGSLWVVNRRVFDTKLKIPPPPSDPLVQKALLEKVAAIPLIAEAGLSSSQVQQLARAAVEQDFEPGELLCAKGVRWSPRLNQPTCQR